ncbi:hypothetical protein KA089_01310 [Candidatus Woesebacteria bacterium]|nr:hypothetical protein [Candidatus Woesebacteria bacterium]
MKQQGYRLEISDGNISAGFTGGSYGTPAMTLEAAEKLKKEDDLDWIIVAAIGEDTFPEWLKDENGNVFENE